MSTPTPGPWRVAPASLYCGDDINVDAGTTGYIATCGKRGDETAAANARLIAAAPALLSALKDVSEALAARLGTNADEWLLVNRARAIVDGAA